MGSCASGRDKASNCKQIKLHPQQRNILSLIYHDLASRSKFKKISRQNFCYFFQKTGFWGDRLYKQFHTNKREELLQQYEFLYGMGEIFKSSENQKINLLFAFFSHSHGEKNSKGLTFEEFVQVLYHYPKSDLKAILDDEDFILHNLKKIPLSSQKKLAYNQMDCKNQKGEFLQIPVYEIIQKSWQSSNDDDINCGKKELIDQHDKKDKKMTNLNVNGAQIQTPTSTINSLIRKFARSIFKKYNLDEKQGVLNPEQFLHWIQKHKNLYYNYFKGFHSEIWEFNLEKEKPMFFDIEPELSSSIIIQCYEKKTRAIALLIHQTLLILKKDSKDLIYVIYLQGLIIEKIGQKDRKFGIRISHPEQYYPHKEIYFQQQNTQQEWLNELRFYKGYTIYQKYDIKETIGSGNFSVVHRCVEKQTKKQYAVKIINKEEMFPFSQQRLEHETNIMIALADVSSVVEFIEKIESKNKTYIITELVNGKDLSQFVRQKKNSLNEQQAKQISKQIIKSVLKIHQKGIIHCDLKPENIMIQEKDGQIWIKIIDMGLSFYEFNLKEKENKIYAAAGTPGYLSPETIDGDINYKMDNFAIGGIIYFMLTGKSPFQGATYRQRIYLTQTTQLRFDSFFQKKHSKLAKKLIRQLTNKSVHERLDLPAALKHDWFKQ